MSSLKKVDKVPYRKGRGSDDNTEHNKFVGIAPSCRRVLPSRTSGENLLVIPRVLL